MSDRFLGGQITLGIHAISNKLRAMLCLLLLLLLATVTPTLMAQVVDANLTVALNLDFTAGNKTLGYGVGFWVNRP